jgi:hypothetical protein
MSVEVSHLQGSELGPEFAASGQPSMTSGPVPPSLGRWSPSDAQHFVYSRMENRQRNILSGV